MKKDIPKRRTPFFSILKGLSNTQQTFFMSHARIYSFSTKISSVKIRSDLRVKGNNLFWNELKLIQFADDTKLFCADLILAQKTFNIVSDFRKAGLREKEKGQPRIKLMRSPVKYRRCLIWNNQWHKRFTWVHFKMMWTALKSTCSVQIWKDKPYTEHLFLWKNNNNKTICEQNLVKTRQRKLHKYADFSSVHCQD